MKSIESLVNRYKKSLNDIPDDVRERVNRAGGLDEAKLLDLIINPQDYSVLSPEHPSILDVQIDYDKSSCFSVGEKAIESGEVAYCVLAGGAGTRIGEPKALLRLPGLGMSLLTLKLMQARGTGPVWVIVSSSLKDRIKDHIESQSGFDKSRIRLIEQYESYRLTPDNQIVMKEGLPDTYPCGHGDLFPALLHSGALSEFIANGGKYVEIVNVDNVTAELDPTTLGRHITGGKKVSCEVVKRTDSDAGGVLCNVLGSLQIVESFRIRGADPQSFEWLNTNSFVMDADVDVKPLGNAWSRVQKNVGSSIVIQHERLLQEITSAYDTLYLSVDRKKRFMPIKSSSDLEAADKFVDANRKFL